MREESFRALYSDNFDRLLGYALRRVEVPEDAADVVSETFLVAWRRIRDLPEGDEARLWLYGVARRILANHYRSQSRREQLGERLRAELSTLTADHADRVATHADLYRALATLRPVDREVLELALWEGLEPREIAVVLGVPAVTVRARLSRARKRLTFTLGSEHSAALQLASKTSHAHVEGTGS